MNLTRWLRRSRHELGHCSVAIFGAKADGAYTWGTGVLVDFRGTPCVLTCAHVLDPIVDNAYVTSGRHSYQSERVERRRLSDPKLDAACLVLRDAASFHEKTFVSAADAWCGDVGVGEHAVAYGFPIGNAYLQFGGRIDVNAATAHFRSTTYFTLTGLPMVNTRLERKQPRLDWNYGGNLDAKRFQLLPKDLTREQRGGFSGGPVAIGGIGPWKLVGCLTDASDYSLFYNPISEVFSWLDKSL